jgi:hypothetical protein
VALCLLVGFGCAWRLDEKPIQRAALVMAVAMGIASAVNAIPMVADLSTAPASWHRDLWLQLAVYTGASILIPALIASLAAWLTFKLRRHG